MSNKNIANRFIDEDEGKTAFEKFEKKAKEIIFGVLFVMLKDEETSFWKLIILIIVTECQMVSKLFPDEIKFPWKAGTIETIFDQIINFFNIDQWVFYISSTLYILAYYLCIFIVILMVIDIIYVSYSFSKKKFACMWPLTILRQVCSLLITVLFMPLLQFFLGMLQCKRVNGVLVLINYDDIQCWVGFHILHSMMGIFISVILFLISVIVCINYFETKSTSASADSKINARSDTIFLVFKVVIIVITYFFLDKSYEWFIAIACFVGSGYIFFSMRNQRPYYNETVNVIVDACNGVFFWATFVLMVAMFTEFNSFNSAVILMGVGVPLVAILIAILPDSRTKLILKKIEKVESGEIWNLKIKFYISLVQSKDTNKTSLVILNGFINDHEVDCTDAECPLKTYKECVLSRTKETKKKFGKQGKNDVNFQLLQFAGKLYSIGLAKFPNCTSLRISYAFFLIERMNNKTLALAELCNAEKYNPPFDEQFIIYRYKKLMEDEISDIGGNNELSGNLDVVSLLAYENHFRQCKDCIHKVATLHYEFWNILLEDQPDLSKLSNIGTKINSNVVSIEDYWNRMQKLNPNSPKSLKMYSDFLIHVLNDEEAAKEYISRSKEGGNIKTAFLGSSENNASQLAPDGSGCIIASADPTKLGEIIISNMGVCRCLGFLKGELIGKKIEIMMPEFYSKHHSQFLLKALNSEDESLKKGNDRFILAKHKSNYLVPLTLTTIIQSSVNHETELIGILRNERKALNVCYLLLDTSKTILGINSACINALNLSNKMVRIGKISILLIAPDLFSNEESKTRFLSKNGSALEVFLAEAKQEEEGKVNESNPVGIIPNSNPNSGSSNMFNSKESALDDIKNVKIKASKKSITCHCNLFEIHFTDIGHEGYIVRLEPLSEEKVDYNDIELPLVNKAKKFEFFYDQIAGKYLREFQDEDDSDKRKKESINNPNQLDQSSINLEYTEDKFSNQKKSSSKESPRSPRNGRVFEGRINYGEGIKTFRFFHGNYEEVDTITNMLDIKDKDDLMVEEEIDLPTTKKNPNKEENQPSHSNIKLKKKAINCAITDKAVPEEVSRIRYSGYIFIFALVALIVIEFVIILVYCNQLIENLNVINYSYRKVTIQMRIAFEIYYYTLTQKSDPPKIISNNNAPNIIELEKNVISSYLSELYNVQSNLSLSTLKTSKEIESLNNEKIVTLFFSNKNSKDFSQMQYTLTEATLLIASSIFTISNNLDSAKTLDNQDIAFVLYNSFANYINSSFNYAEYYVKDIYQRNSYNQNIVIIFFVVSLFIFIASFIFIYIFVSKAVFCKLQILCLFLDIPLTNVKELMRKCEAFINLDSEENKEEINSNEDISAEDSVNLNKESSSNYSQRKIRGRNIKNVNISNLSFIIKFIIGALIFESYFVINFVFNRLFFNNMNGYIAEFNVTAKTHTYQTYAFSMHVALLGENKTLPLSSQQTYEYLDNDALNGLYEIARDIQNIHNRNDQEGTNPSYSIDFLAIMRDNICLLSNKFNFTFDCPSFIDGTAKNGMHPVLIYFIDKLLDMLIQYKAIVNNPTLINAIDKNQAISDNLLNSGVFKNMTIICNEISEKLFTYLRINLINSVSSINNNQNTRRIIMIIVMVILLGAFFFLLWTPYVSGLHKEIWRTRSMLTIIPIEIIENIKSVEEYFQKQKVHIAKFNTDN